jgi:flagellar hook-length control protein FliK
MNPAITETGPKLRGNTQVAGNSGESLFSILLNNLNGSAETENKSSGPSLFTDTFPANTVITDDSASSTNNTTGLVNNTGKKSNPASLQSSDFLLPQSAMPNLVSFLEKKGFSSEQIDKILLSSRNDQGLIQIHKLVTAIQSARAGTLSNGSGLIIEAASVPKVQELLFNMGLGVGEVKATIEKAGDQKGGISLDKLAEALSGQLQGSLTKTDLVSLLEQNNISMTSQAAGIAAVASDMNDNISLNSQLSNPANGIPGVETDITHDPRVSNSGAGIEQKNDISLNTGVSDTASGTAGLTKRIESDLQGYDINKAAIELKKEFMDFVKGSSRGRDEMAKQEIAVSFKENAVQAQESKELREIADIDKTGSNQAKAAVQVPTQESGPVAQALTKGQTQWVKGNEGKIIDILNGEKQLSTRVSEQGITSEQREIMKDPAEFLKQGDQKSRQDILTGVTENKTISQTQTTEAPDIQENPLNIKEIQTIDLTSQNVAKASDTIDIKSHIKSVYNLPEPLPKVFDRMVIMIKNGEQTGRLIIQPPELGKIDIDLRIKSGHIQANLTTENLVVKEIIEANLNQLKQQLNDQGLIVEQFNVSVGSQNRQFGEDASQAWKSVKGSSQSGVSGIEDVTALEEGAAANILAGKYRIDLHV